MNQRRSSIAFSSDTRDTVYVTGIPAYQNTIPELSKTFSKYGRIVNINVSYNGDLHAALIAFANHESAADAIRSLESNPLIDVCWHAQQKVSWQCEKCNKMLASKQSLKAHMTRMHAGERCALCNIRFESAQQYEKHCNVHHLNVNMNMTNTGTNMNMSTSTNMDTTSSSIAPSALSVASVETQTIVIDEDDGKEKDLEKANTKLRTKYSSLKKKLKKSGKLKLKMMKVATKSQRSLNEVIKGSFIFSSSFLPPPV